MSGYTSTTVIQFVQSLTTPFQFQAILNGATSLVNSTSTNFTVTLLWNVFGQRYYVLISDQNGTLILNTPLIASPSTMPISMTAGYFSTSIIYDEGAQQFTITG